MNIISFTDKPGSAIDRLANMTRELLPHINMTVVSLHPKRPSEEEIARVKALLPHADTLLFEYWKTGMTVLKLFPEARTKKKILVHHNEHNINGEWEWKNEKWDAIVCKNGWQKKELEKQGYKPILIRHAIDFKHFTYAEKLTEEKIVLYVGQIKKVKGVRELAQACRELGYRLMVVGKVSEAGYFEEMNKEGIVFAQNIPDEELCLIYHQARVYCANSDDGTESGTMPILEAMAAGVPVVTRSIGLVRDCGQHEKNMYIRSGSYTDIEDLKKGLKMVVENEDIADELRENAWRTVRQYHPAIQAREFNRLFHKVLYGDTPIVSVIMPTYARPDVLAVNLMSLEEQTYRNFEVVVCDDNMLDFETATDRVIHDMRASGASYPIQQVLTGKDKEGYGLAKARNVGVIEAIGDIIILCDDRLKMHSGAIEGFVKKLQGYETKKMWVWGSKGTFKSFVENFSATWRRALIDGGMFCERIDGYGGMTQEISNRFAAQGFRFEWCPESIAEPIIGTHSKSKNRESIIEQKIKLYKMGFQ